MWSCALAEIWLFDLNVMTKVTPVTRRMCQNTCAARQFKHSVVVLRARPRVWNLSSGEKP